MAKKRPTLDAFLTAQNETKSPKEDTRKVPNSRQAAKSEVSSSPKTPKVAVNMEESSAPVSKSKKSEVVRHMLYLPLPVYDQLQSLVFEEQRGQTKRRKTHNYLLDAIDLLFKKKGLKSIKELIENK